MKKLLALALMVVLAGSAVAQDGTAIGMFFGAPYDDANTNINTTAAPFNAYLVLLGAPFEILGGYECGIEISDGTVFILSVTGENGWTNFGNNTNHLCGYQVFPSIPATGLVLSTFSILYTGTDEVTISLGPAVPPSIPGVPVIANGANPDELLGCGLTSGSVVPAVVATMNGDGILATENHTLSGVKALFD